MSLDPMKPGRVATIAVLVILTLGAVILLQPGGLGGLPLPGGSRGAGSLLPPSPTPIPVLVGAGDIAECETTDDSATAALLDQIPGSVFTLGDAAYPSGSVVDFESCYGPTWGRHRERTRPVLGNHEYLTPAAAPYFAYFGAAAGDPSTGYYSYDFGGWHIVVLNSNCGEVRGCDANSPQLAWLRADLAANPARCTIAMWHHSRFSSGRYGADKRFEPFWEALYADAAEVIVTAHDHNYERFLPQTPDGRLDADRGIRAFVVGTGGGSLRPFETVAANSEVRQNEAFGVLVLRLEPDGYDWEFRAVPGATFTDPGRSVCH